MLPLNNDMRFEVATVCNYKCVMCPYPTLTRKNEVMSTEMFKMLFDKIIAEAPDQFDTLTFPGMGEPLLDKEIDQKIAYAKSKMPDLHVLILTNATYFTPEKFARFEDVGVESVRVSYYGMDQKSYNAVHGIKTTNETTYEMVKNNMIKICEMKKKTKILMTYNIIKDLNDHFTDDWISFWKDRADLIEVWRPHNWATAVNYREVQENKLPSCGRPFNGPLQIQVDGTVNMCCFDFDGKLTFGDLKTQSLKEIFQTAFFKKIQQCHTTGDYKGSNLLCENCDQRNADKSDVMVYNSKFDLQERVKLTSSAYSKLV